MTATVRRRPALFFRDCCATVCDDRCTLAVCFQLTLLRALVVRQMHRRSSSRTRAFRATRTRYEQRCWRAPSSRNPRALVRPPHVHSRRC